MKKVKEKYGEHYEPESGSERILLPIKNPAPDVTVDPKTNYIEVRRLAHGLGFEVRAVGAQIKVVPKAGNSIHVYWDTDEYLRDLDIMLRIAQEEGEQGQYKKSLKRKVKKSGKSK